LSDEEPIPFQVTPASLVYEAIQQLPVAVLLENFRSLYNVGSFFRTADAAAVESLLLCGITGTPPQKGIAKTALGAEETVRWERYDDALEALRVYRERGFEVAVIETSLHAVDIFDWVPRFPVCVVFGNELEGTSRAALDYADTHVRLPMLGLKHSLNVATAGGIVIYELLRKYRTLVRGQP
jgi:23S rRNA (guanosine2251-2'-O)-methyltransferase